MSSQLFICEQCSKSFKRKHYYNAHINKNTCKIKNADTHTEERKTDCTDDANVRTFSELYQFLQNYTGESIINWMEADTIWHGKDKQESLLRLFARLGLVHKLRDYTPCKGNFNLKTIEKYNSPKDCFYDSRNTPIFLKDKGDSSDLTCIHNANDKHLLVTTSKNINKMMVGKLGIDTINTNFQQYKEDGYTMTLGICIRSKDDFDTMCRRIEETSKELKATVSKEDTIIIDWNDLAQAYHGFKTHFRHTPLDAVINCNKSPLLLKMHQQLSVLKTIQLKQKKELKVLWGHIPRSGKSYIIGGCIIADSENKAKCNYIIITTAPNETIEQYLKVFDCIQLREFNIIYLNGKTKKPAVGLKNIIICSKQFLQCKIDESTEENTTSILWLRRMTFDMRFVDESHNGGSTSLAKKTLEYYGGNSFTVQITATYLRPIHDYNIPRENWILWDMDDIKLCKHINSDTSKTRLIQKHGIEIVNVLNQYSSQNIINEYAQYPELWILTDELKPEVVTEIVKNTHDNNYGWSTDACFLLKQGVDNTGIRIVQEEFQNEGETLKIWYRIFGKRNNLGIPDKDYPDNAVYMKRIEKICKNPNTSSRFIGDTDSPMVIMAYLPQNDIEKTSNATRKLLIKYNVIPEFEIACINSKTTTNPKQTIEDARKRASNSGKKGVVVLSGRQCSLGVSIDNCDIVILLNNNISFELIFQMMYRCMTEGLNKKNGFVIDLNIHRVIDTSIMNYASIIHPDKHPKDAVQYILQERLISLNGDHWMSCFGYNSSKILQLCSATYDIYASKTEQALQHFIDRLRFKEVLLSKDEQRLFNTLFNIKVPSATQRELIDKLLSEDNSVKKGIERTIVAVDGDAEDSSYDTISNPESNTNDSSPNKSNYMDILKHIIPLICILTIHKNESSFVEMFNLIEKDPYIFNILIDQTKSWWGNHIDTTIIKKLIDVYIKYMNNDKETNQIIRVIKELFTKNVRNNKELSSLIDKYLIPQDLEKKNNAEVSTPHSLRKQMLDKIPSHTWKTPHKVFEPCSGKGGFLIDIIDRFMEGLSDTIPDETERYRTIIEECLYWSDINPTNIFICKLLIDPYNQYRLNYNEGDTLELDTYSKWNVRHFDSIIGNPPYQPPSNNKKGGKSLWDEFVKFSINLLKKKGLLLFVHPALWRKPENKMMDVMFNKQIHYLSIHNKVEGNKIFGATTRYDYYLLENIEPYTESIVRFEDGQTHKIMITNELAFIPNFGWSIFKKVIDKLNNNGVLVERDSDCHTSRKHVSKSETTEFKYKLLNSVSNTKGKTYCYASRPHKMQTMKKVMFSNGETIVPFYDNGELGMTEGGLYSIVSSEEEGYRLVEYLNTRLIKFIVKATKWSNFETTRQIFQYIPKVSGIPLSDESVYKYFDLTDTEIQQITSMTN